MSLTPIRWFPAFIMSIFLAIPTLAPAGQWVNPKDAIGDPMIARLQQGRKELTPVEKEEIEKYGYTALEIMTYTNDNWFQGEDFDVFELTTHVNPKGHIKVTGLIWRVKSYYKNHSTLLTYDQIKPGGTEKKEFLVTTYPSDERGDAFMSHYYLTNEDYSKEMDNWMWTRKLRRVRRNPTVAKEDDMFGSDIIVDDYLFREPWEDDHRVLGEDTWEGHECFVIESKNRVNPNYYLLKRVSWIEKDNFLDLHEEQFDRAGKLLKVIDTDWEQIPPWNYWVKKQRNFINLKTKSRTLDQLFDWIFDQGLEDEFFTERQLRKASIWRKPKNPPPMIKKPSDLSPAPQVRWEFWDKIGAKPLVAD